MSEAGTIIRHAVIRGRVQGVGYRAWAEREALRRGLQGWVRNLRSGAVESVFAGAPDAVAAMLEACREGPRGCQVHAVEVTEADEAALASCRPGELFSVLATA